MFADQTRSSWQRNIHDKRGGKSEREEIIDAEASHSGRPEPRKSGRF